MNRFANPLDGPFSTSRQRATNPDGSPKVDANGNPVYVDNTIANQNRVRATNPDGSPKSDVFGSPVYDNQLSTEVAGTPTHTGVRATNADGSPKFNEKGEPVYVEGTVIETPTIETLDRRLSALEARLKRG